MIEKIVEDSEPGFHQLPTGCMSSIEMHTRGYWAESTPKSLFEAIKAVRNTDWKKEWPEYDSNNPTHDIIVSWDGDEFSMITDQHLAYLFGCLFHWGDDVNFWHKCYKKLTGHTWGPKDAKVHRREYRKIYGKSWRGLTLA